MGRALVTIFQEIWGGAQATFFKGIMGWSIDFFLEKWGSATFFLSRAYIACRRFFWLDIVGVFDFYLSLGVANAPLHPVWLLYWSHRIRYNRVWLCISSKIWDLTYSSYYHNVSTIKLEETKDGKLIAVQKSRCLISDKFEFDLFNSILLVTEKFEIVNWCISTVVLNLFWS